MINRFMRFDVSLKIYTIVVVCIFFTVCVRFVHNLLSPVVSTIDTLVTTGLCILSALTLGGIVLSNRTQKCVAYIWLILAGIAMAFIIVLFVSMVFFLAALNIDIVANNPFISASDSGTVLLIAILLLFAGVISFLCTEPEMVQWRRDKK